MRFRFLNCMGLAILRIGLGVIMVIHGYDKLVTKGPEGVTGFFTKAGLPNPEMMVWLAIFVELVGGIALIVGLLTRLSALGVALTMGGAIYYVHLANGFFNSEKGYEFPLTLAIVAVALIFTGPGRISVDQLLFGRKNKAEATSTATSLTAGETVTTGSSTFSPNDDNFGTTGTSTTATPGNTY